MMDPRENYQPKLSLLRLRDLFVVVESYGQHDADKQDWYDYTFHSHQCPENLMRNVVAVFCPTEGNDPHGVFRFIAAVDDNEENKAKLETSVLTMEQLLSFFGTDGAEAPTVWPEHERGLLPQIARAQDEYRQRKGETE